MSHRLDEREEPATTITSPLLEACRAGDVETALRLLADGADPNERDAQGATPLHLACAAAVPATARASLVRALLHAGAGPFARDDGGSPVSSDERKTAAMLSAARRRTSPPPIVIFLGREHPLLHYFTEAMPECKALADKLCCIEYRGAEDRRDWPTPFSLVEEKSPDVPFGVPVVLKLGLSWAGHDALRRQLLPRDDDGFVVRGGPHNDARFEACWRQLPRSRETLRFEDLRRRHRVSPRPAAATFDALDALLRSRAEVAWRVDREDRPATTVPRDAWSKRPERGVFGLGEAHDLRTFASPIDDCAEARRLRPRRGRPLGQLA